MSSEPKNAKQIFLEAIEQHAPDQWPAYLDQACGDDAQLRRRVEILLEAHVGEGSLLDSPAMAPAATVDQAITEKPGALVGPYKLLQVIGEGGMGVVYMAEQTEPIERRVALKIIKLGMDTRQVIARFEAERQALAMMDHPNISKVLDAGTTESGRPYFVMELVKGVPIVKYCDQQHLTPKERLELFLPICQAIQHAHQKGIIHRDIKPSNLLVALYDGRPVPKVIDFGVAKAINQRLTEKTMFTQLGQMVGTLEYMSPEQANLNQLDIDTRSDIYSLGVLLYELLTGNTPFDRQRLRSAAFDEMMRIIREEEPPKPSTRLSTIDTLPSVAANRKTEPKKLSALVHGELDWIVMKALEKDRSRRYETANGFANDIQRYLNDEAVVACPPSAGYRFRKFARRNKAAIVTTLVVLAALVVGIIGTTWQAVRAKREHRRAEVARREEVSQRAQAEQQRDRALKAEQRAEEQATKAETAAENERQQRTEAVQQRDLAERTLYLAHMRLAQQAWETGHFSRLTQILEAHLPRPERWDLRGWEWYFLLGQCHGDRVTLPGHGYSLPRGVPVAWNPDGKQLAWITKGGVGIWDVASGQQLCTLKTGALSLAWSPDGQRLACVTVNHRVTVWNTATWDEVLTLERERSLLRGLAWSPDSKHLAAPANYRRGDSQHNTVKIWDITTGEAALWPNGHGDVVQGVAWSPEGKRLASVSDDQSVKIWDVASEEEIITLRGHTHWIWAVAWSPDGQSLASAGCDGIVKVWDADTWQQVRELSGHAGFVASVSWSPDGQRLASASLDETIRVWDAASGQHLSTIRGHRGGVTCVTWSPDGQYLASASKDNTARIWDVESEQQTSALSAHADSVSSVAFNSDGSQLASGSWDGSVKIWDAVTWQEELVLCQNRGKVGQVAWSPDDRELAFVREDTIEVCDLATREVRLTLQQEPVYSVAWSPDGRYLASISAGRHLTRINAGVIKVWDATTGEELRSFQMSKSTPRSVAWSPNGRHLATATHVWGETWEMAEARKVRELRPASGLYGYGFDGGPVVFSPDGRRLAAGFGHNVLLFDVAKGTLIHPLTGHQGEIKSIVWSPDGHRLASAGIDTTVRVWDAAAGEEILALRNQTTVLHSLAWSPDGRQLVASSNDGTIAIWDASRGYDFVPSPAERSARAWRLRCEGRNEEALAILEKLCEEFPDVSDYREGLARFHADMAWSLVTGPNPHLWDAARAIELATESLKVFPDRAAYWTTLGAAQYRAGNFSAALQSLEKAEKLHSYNSDTFVFLAMVHHKLGNEKEARFSYVKFVERLRPVPQDDDRRFGAEAAALMGLATAVPKDEATDEAIAILQELISEFPDVPKYRDLLRSLYRSYEARILDPLRGLGHYDKVLAHYEKLVETGPQDAEAHHNLALYLVTCPDSGLQDAERAVELAKKAVKFRPESWRFCQTLAELQYRAGNWNQAITALKQSHYIESDDKQSLKIDGYDPRYWLNSLTFFRLAKAHWQLGEKEEARRWYDQGVKLMEEMEEYGKVSIEGLPRVRAEAADLLGIGWTPPERKENVPKRSMGIPVP